MVTGFMGILLGMSVSVITQTTLATVLPQVAAELGGRGYYSWVFSAYMIAATVTLPICAKLADSYGRKNFYLAGMLIFLMGSILCGTAESMGQLVFYRVVQGLGAGALAPAAIASITDLFPVQKRGRMLGVMAAVQVLANLVGPVWGGYIAEKYSWQAAFYSLVPLGFLAVIFVAKGMPGSASDKAKKEFGKIDFVGGLALGLVSVLLIQLLGMIREWTTKPWLAGGLVVITMLLSVVFYWREKGHPDPVVSPDVLKVVNVRVSFLATLLSGVVLYGGIVVLPLYGQAVFGKSALQGGMILLPFTVATGLGGLLSGSLVNKFSYQRISSIAWTVAGAGFLLFATIGNPVSLVTTVFSFVTGIGVGMNLPLLVLPAQNGVPENRRAVVAGLLQIGRNLGGAIGIPFLTGLITKSQGLLTEVSSEEYSEAFLFLSVLSAIGAICGRFFQGSANDDHRSEVLGDNHKIKG